MDQNYEESFVLSNEEVTGETIWVCSRVMDVESKWQQGKRLIVGENVETTSRDQLFKSFFHEKKEREKGVA